MPSDHLKHNYRRYLLALIAVGVLARALIVVVTWNFHPAVDNYDYILRAVYFWRHGGHLMPAWVRPNGTAVPDAWWPPGYPIFLTALIAVHQALHTIGLLGPLPIAIAGHTLVKTDPQSLFQFLRLTTSVMGVVMVPLVAWIVNAMMGRKVALVAAALVAVYPPLIVVGASLFSESLFLPLLLVSVICVIQLHRHGGWLWALGAGLVFGLAVMVHSDGVALLLPLAIGGWLAVRARGGAARALWAPALMVVALALVLTPWTIRNAVKFHAFMPLSDSFQPTLAGTYNPVSARWKQRPAGWIPAEQAYPLIALLHGDSRLQLNAAYERAAANYIKAHPGYVATVIYWNTRRLLELAGMKAPGGSYQTAQYEGETLTLTWICAISFWLLAALAIGGAFTFAVRRARYRWIWLVPLIAYLSEVVITTNTPRFRSVIDLVFIFAAAAAIVALRDRLGRGRGVPRAVRG